MERPEFTPIDPNEDLATDEVKRHLSAIFNELYFARKDLEQARNREVDAFEAYTLARLPLLKDPNCPDPKQSGVTATQQANWINDRIPNPWLAYQRAKTSRLNAVDYTKQLREQVSVLQSINSIAKLLDAQGGRY
jgi:hypothetical protein